MEKLRTTIDWVRFGSGLNGDIRRLSHEYWSGKGPADSERVFNQVEGLAERYGVPPDVIKDRFRTQWRLDGQRFSPPKIR